MAELPPGKRDQLLKLAQVLERDLEDSEAQMLRSLRLSGLDQYLLHAVQQLADPSEASSFSQIDAELPPAGELHTIDSLIAHGVFTRAGQLALDPPLLNWDAPANWAQDEILETACSVIKEPEYIVELGGAAGWWACAWRFGVHLAVIASGDGRIVRLYPTPD